MKYILLNICEAYLQFFLKKKFFYENNESQVDTSAIESDSSDIICLYEKNATKELLIYNIF